MKTIGWAAIIYSVHDFWTLSALALLIVGEFGLARLLRPRKKSPALNFVFTQYPYSEAAESPFPYVFEASNDESTEKCPKN
jgi:hypothetical protein